ncbi:MAG: tetratricopeptide (TPR) repeat protein [Polaribacter sp.]|jgi:tetratricopeptide (TPR) repeat protein
MGFFCSKIPGHSGTAFKHRKAFNSIKEYDNKSISYNRKDKRNSKMHPKLAPKIYQEAIRSSSWIDKQIRLSLLLTFIVMMFYGITACYNALPNRQSKIYSYLKTYELEQQRNAYRILVHSGKSYMIGNQFQEANDEFARALKLFPYGKEARIEITKLYLITCELQNNYCDLIEKNIRFLEEMNYVPCGIFSTDFAHR